MAAFTGTQEPRVSGPYECTFEAHKKLEAKARREAFEEAAEVCEKVEDDLRKSAIGRSKKTKASVNIRIDSVRVVRQYLLNLANKEKGDD